VPGEIWFLRHGEAESHGAAPDAERRLTQKGERQSRLAGEAFVRLGIDFEHVFTSPRVRALDTARLAAEVLGTEFVVHEPLSAGFDRDDALELVHGAGADGRILVVGHEPDFSQTIHDLTGADVDLKKGGIAAVRTEGAGADLRVLLRPREIELIAG
jgi:phosphohistidine phosphatase